MTTAAPMPVPFPFAAIAGQPHLRQALLLAAVDPGLGGVLIEGPRGTAKTTAARALAELLPGAPFVTLPLGASLESLVGTLDLAKALAGHELAFAPGLLARAHGGVLYVDEINLLPDALIDSLLDAAASGVNVVERDGISHRHAARFVLVGTMNPEEGTLRPQLLDRFGLCVQLRNIDEPAERQAIVRARLAFDADPQGFRAKHAQEEAALAASLARARTLVADASALPYGDAVHEAVGALCIAAGVDGLRADLVMLRSARALAAWEGADGITADHVRRVAEAVLLHRRKPGAEAAAPAPASGAARPAATVNGQDGTNSANDLGGTGDVGGEDWGAMPPEPVGIERVKPLRPLIAPAQAVASKKA
ncbi:magnesium chelatase subunit I [Variovorax sp. SG517]|uniref:ATP-binding protein n=1 Tax=Variovorax sp. SG517 TaxID=2587117 RepID=UPI00159DD8FF|nr:ATP-binding protein [Variovorax sp. SG517]NVM91586.1 magnesium chelatase subunit I [Variovorax sp. SG517]